MATTIIRATRILCVVILLILLRSYLHSDVHTAFSCLLMRAALGAHMGANVAEHGALRVPTHAVDALSL